MEKLLIEGKEVEVSKTLSATVGEYVVFGGRLLRCTGSEGYGRDFSLKLEKESTGETVWVKRPWTRYVRPIMRPKGYIKT
jgi:hypothetical protein